MNISEISKLSYQATCDRGLITSETSIIEFIEKIQEEKEELLESWMNKPDSKYGFDEFELADVALVCFAMAEHFGIDLVDIMRQKALINVERFKS